MKQCPKCSRTYADETLNFCLEDGGWLREASESDAPATAILTSEAPTRVHNVPETSSSKDEERPRLPRKKKGLMLGALGALVIAAIGIGGHWYYGNRTGQQVRSIAVLPFTNESGNAEFEYISEELPASLMYRLSQIPALQVSPRSSVFRYKGKQVEPSAAARELGADAVLSGSVALRGENLVINVELIDARTNKLIWGEQFDRRSSDLLSTQREIAKEIVENLKLKVSPQDKALVKHYTESNEAYQLYMKGRFYWNKRTSESMRKSIEFYKQAIEADPRFALAYSGLADTYNLICAPEAGGGGESAKDALPKAKAAALRALEIDPTLAEAHASLAHSLYYYDRDFAAAEREFRKAIDLNPKYPVAHHWYAIYLTVVGRFPEAHAEMKLARELDPFSMAIDSWVGWTFYLSGENEQALEQLLKTKEMDPNFLLTRYRLAFVYADLDMFNEAISEVKEVQRISDGRLAPVALGYVYAKAGMRREALDQVDLLINAAVHHLVPPASIGRIYAILGDNDQALKWLEKANDQRDLQAAWIKHDRRLGSLRDDPRFADLVKRIGTP